MILLQLTSSARLRVFTSVVYAAYRLLSCRLLAWQSMLASLPCSQLTCCACSSFFGPLLAFQSATVQVSLVERIASLLLHLQFKKLGASQDGSRPV